MFEIINVDELLSRLNGFSHNELHVHHTWSPRHKDFNGSNGLELQQGMKNYHVNNLGWADIGQHVTLLPDGLFVTGRDFGKTPASISGKNIGAFAMEMLGNFDNGNDLFQGEQKNSALKVAKYFIDRGRYVRFHRENSPKTCPGTSIDKDTFMNEAKNFGAAPVVETPKPVAVVTEKEEVKGDEGVRTLQQMLNRMKFIGANGKTLVEDGINGKNTDHAVRQCQEVLGLSVDGICGEHTLNAIAGVLNKPLLKINSKGTAVRYVQWRTDAKVDGIFGWDTNRHVAIFQGQYNLSQDGVVGNNTWNKLIG